MPQENESWLTSESLWFLGLIVAALTVVCVVKNGVSAEAAVGFILSGALAIARFLKGKDG